MGGEGEEGATNGGIRNKERVGRGQGRHKGRDGIRDEEGRENTRWA